MNCCNDYGRCTQGKNCPARDLPVTMDEPLFTFDGIMAAIVNLFAAIGLIAASAVVGLYCAGFFDWLALQYQGNAVIQFFFGGAL